MDLNWFEGIVYGLITGLTEILPVSSSAHGFLLLKLFGKNAEPALIRLMTDLGILAALYYSCQNHIIRIIRAKKLARIPKRRRKRPLDTISLMDFSLLKFMAIPSVILFIFYNKVTAFQTKMIWVSVCILLNGVILYIPQFFPGGNRDSRNMSRLHALLVGLGGAGCAVPGLSSTAAVLSISSVCAVDRKYALNMALLLQMLISVGYVVWDVLGLVSEGMGGIPFGTVLCYIVSGLAAFGGASAAIKVMRTIAQDIGYAIFAYYCWGVALFTFIMNLLA